MLGFFLLYKNQAPAEDNVYNSSKTGEQKMADFFFLFTSVFFLVLLLMLLQFSLQCQK
jgi:hypothetical protein